MNKKRMILNFMSLHVCSFQILLTTIAYCIVYNANNIISSTNSRRWAWVKFNTLLFPFGFKYPKAIMVKDKSVNLAISLFHIKQLKNDQTWYWVDIPECLYPDQIFECSKIIILITSKCHYAGVNQILKS